jgi:hypothetical protein
MLATAALFQELALWQRSVDQPNSMGFCAIALPYLVLCCFDSPFRVRSMVALFQPWAQASELQLLKDHRFRVICDINPTSVCFNVGAEYIDAFGVFQSNTATESRWSGCI